MSDETRGGSERREEEKGRWRGERRRRRKRTERVLAVLASAHAVVVTLYTAENAIPHGFVHRYGQGVVAADEEVDL